MAKLEDNRPVTWRPGDQILVRHVQHGVVRYADALIVVEDSPERLVAFEPIGAEMVANQIDWETGAFAGPVIHPRHTTNALRIYERGAQHITSLFFAEGMSHLICWYVDLAEPVRRAGGGIVTFDRSLDIVVGPDRRWRWKDEDHFAHIQRFGWITQDYAAELRAEGERVIARVEAGASPFDTEWLEWKPDPDWPLPTLPADWETPPG
jgi:hypothetical protein